MARFSSLLKAKTSFVIKRLSRSESRSLGYAHWPELHCAARRIQYIQRRLPLSPDDKRNRCRKALNQALELGLAEKEIRAMAKLSAWQLAPEEARATR